jgi:hypothetical protein
VVKTKFYFFVCVALLVSYEWFEVCHIVMAQRCA